MSDPGRSIRTSTGGAGGAAFYILGFIGAVVYFWQEAGSFSEYLLAVLKALVWPALLVYEAFQAVLG